MKKTPASKKKKAKKSTPASPKKNASETSKDARKIGRFVYWTPRMLAILFILFLMMFSLDIFELKLGFWGTILGLIMHNIPAFILLIALIISWKREIVGGIVFTLAGLFYVVRLIITIIMHRPHEWYQLFWSLPIAGPALLVGILFLIGWKRRKN